MDRQHKNIWNFKKCLQKNQKVNNTVRHSVWSMSSTIETQERNTQSFLIWGYKISVIIYHYGSNIILPGSLRHYLALKLRFIML